MLNLDLNLDVETANFLTWLFLILSMAGAGVGAMLYAYQGAGSVSVLFQSPVSLPGSLPDSIAGTEASVKFQRGYNAFQAGQYRKAVNFFSQAIQQMDILAEAYHNRGLALANLRQDDDSVTNLLKASDLYGQQDKGESLKQLTQDMLAIKARKLAREA